MKRTHAAAHCSGVTGEVSLPEMVCTPPPSTAPAWGSASNPYSAPYAHGTAVVVVVVTVVVVLVMVVLLVLSAVHAGSEPQPYASVSKGWFCDQAVPVEMRNLLQSDNKPAPEMPPNTSAMPTAMPTSQAPMFWLNEAAL